MNKKIIKPISLILALLMLSVSPLFAGKKGKSIEAPQEEVQTAPQGRIIVLVVDISQSIKGQLDTIIDGLCEEIVEKRLQSGDYCVVVPLGDSTNTDKADSFGVQFSSDKEKIKDYLNKIKTWMPTNLNTDIGASMKKAFEYINMINAENNGSMYEPLVLFITDGEIFSSPNSNVPVKYLTPEMIFEDSEMDPYLNSYDNWWFLGIENEGVPLEHIKKISQIVGAYPDRYETLNDMDQFGMLFDLWLSNIPDPEPKDMGSITFSNVELDGKTLSTKDSKYTVVPNNASKFSWTMKSSYKKSNIIMNFKSVEGTFQSDDGGKVTRFKLIPEAGNIEFTPESKRTSLLNVNLPELHGKGKLKLNVVTQLNKSNLSSDEEIPEYLFYVDFKTPKEILMAKVIPIAAIVLVVLIIIFIIVIIKANAPVKIKMDIIPSSIGKKPKNVSVRIHKSMNFGSDPSAPFKLEGSNFAHIVGSLERTSKKNWKINKVKEEFFVNESKDLSSYKLGTSIKLTLGDNSIVTIRFSRGR